MYCYTLRSIHGRITPNSISNEIICLLFSYQSWYRIVQAIISTLSVSFVYQQTLHPDLLMFL